MHRSKHKQSETLMECTRNQPDEWSMYKYIEHTRTYMHKHIHTYRSHRNYPPTHRQLNIEITCDNRKTRMYACVNAHIDEYIRAFVRAHRYTCHQNRHA